MRKSAQEAAEEKTGQSVQLTAKRQIEQTKQAAKEVSAKEKKADRSGQLTAGRKTGQMKQTKRAAQEVSAKEKKADQSGQLTAEKPVRQTKHAVKESSVTGEKTRQSQHLTLETYIEQTMQSGQVTAEEKTGLTRKSAQRSTKQQQKKFLVKGLHHHINPRIRALRSQPHTDKQFPCLIIFQCAVRERILLLQPLNNCKSQLFLCLL